MTGSNDKRRLPAETGKPLIFISCGQYTQDEVALGNSIENVIRDTTPYDAYFAEQQNSLDGLATNFRWRVKRWQLQQPHAHSLVAEWRRETDEETTSRHDYYLCVDLVNHSQELVTDWRILVEMPRPFVTIGQDQRAILTREEDSATLRPEQAKLYPGARRENAVVFPYYVDERNFELIGKTEPVAKVSLWSGNQLPQVQLIPLADLNNF